MGTLGMRWSKLDLDEARRLYESGLSLAQVGRKLGYTQSYIALPLLTRPRLSGDAKRGRRTPRLPPRSQSARRWHVTAT